MKKILAAALILMIVAASGGAQPLPAVKSIQDYWPQGEKKEYPLVFADTLAAGLYVAEMVDIDRTGDLVSYEIMEKYNIQFPGVFPGSRMTIDKRLKLDETGHFKSAEMDMIVDDRRQKISIIYDAGINKIIASWGEGEQAGSYEIEINEPIYACDNNAIAQLEIIMAKNDLIPNENFTEKVVSLQSLFLAEYEFHVVGKTLVRYGAYTDSAWQVNILRPVRQTLYVDRQHKIVKLQDQDLKITTELKRDPFADRAIRLKSDDDLLSTHISRLPIYVVFLIIVAIWILIFSRQAFGRLPSYLFFILGCIAYAIIFITQVPLHELYGMKVLYPVIKQGRSVAIYGVIPSLITSVIQQTLKLIPLLVLVMIERPRPKTLITLGAFIGGGFGFTEAANVLGPLFQNQSLDTMAVVERIFSTMFHTGSGVFVAYGIARHKTLKFWVMAILLQAVMVYSLFFHKSVSFEFLHAWQILISVLTLAAAVYLSLRFNEKITKSKKSKR